MRGGPAAARGTVAGGEGMRATRGAAAEGGHQFGRLRVFDEKTTEHSGRQAVARQQTADSDYDCQRQHFCLNDPDASRPRRRDFSSREFQRASFALRTASSIALEAFRNLGRREPYHLRMATRTFGAGVTFDVLDNNVTRIRNALGNLQIGQNVWAGTCDEPDCNTGQKNAVAVTLDDLSGVVLCPFFFIQPARTLATTILHEAGHVANIDAHYTPGSERYCRNDDTIECDNICPLSGENLLENVDAWMRFIYCVAMSG